MLKPKKLALRPETIRLLTDNHLQRAGGGWIQPPLTWSCPQPSNSACCPQTK